MVNLPFSHFAMASKRALSWRITANIGASSFLAWVLFLPDLFEACNLTPVLLIIYIPSVFAVLSIRTLWLSIILKLWKALSNFSRLLDYSRCNLHVPPPSVWWAFDKQHHPLLYIVVASSLPNLLSASICFFGLFVFLGKYCWNLASYLPGVKKILVGSTSLQNVLWNHFFISLIFTEQGSDNYSTRYYCDVLTLLWCSYLVLWKEDETE
jgi:hypothetical protein